jgi:hypothetical protein
VTNELTDLYLGLLDFIEPLRTRLKERDAVEYLFYRYGWDATMDDAAFARFREAATVIAPIEQFTETAEALRTKLATDGSLGPSDVEALAKSAMTLTKALAAFGMPNLEGLADPLSRPEFWESVAEQVFDDLLEQYLRIYQPIVYLVLRLWNVIRYEHTVPSDAGRIPYTRVSFDWGQATDMLTTPLTALERAYHWGDPARAFEHQQALESLLSVVKALGVPAALFSPALAAAPFAAEPSRRIKDDTLALRATLIERYVPDANAFYRVGFEVFPAARTGETAPTGLMVRPLLQGGADETLPLNDLLTVRFSTTASAGDAIGFAVFPGDAGVVGGAASIGTGVELSTTGAGPWYALGNARTSHIEISGVALKLSLEGSVDDPEIKLRAACEGTNGQPGCRIVVALGSADSFVKDTTKQSGLTFTCSPEIVWSSKSGFSFNGKPTFDIVLPISVELGPITLTNATITFGEGPKTTSASSLTIRVGVAVTGKLGPVTFVLDRIGFACTFVPYSRDDVKALPPESDAPALGSLDVDLEFAPPEGIGLSVDASIVSGGGFIGHYGDEYAGALDLTIGDYAIKAYGVLQTKLPGGAPGYSFIVALSAEFSPPINLVFGFTLDAVGGMLGINRTMSPDAIEAALWGHRLDGLLFPKDPVASASQLVTALDSYFPAAKGRYLFGPLAKIGWGNDIVTGEIALLIELPEPVRVLLLGEMLVGVPRQ